MKYSITAGFAPGTIHYPCLRPKWQQEIIFPSINDGQFFRLKEDYCIYIEPDTNGKFPHQQIHFGIMLSVDHYTGPKLLTCINTCYNGRPIENPFFYHLYDSDDIPKWINPDHGTHRKKYPDQCSHFVPDQSSLKDTQECALPISSVFNTPEIYDPETPTAENANNLEQTIASQQARSPGHQFIFINDGITPTPNTGDDQGSQ